MGFTRRDLLGRGGMLAAAVAAMPGVAIGATGKTPLPGTSTVRPSRQLFESLVGTSFELKTGPLMQYLTLLKVEDLPALSEASPGQYAKSPPVRSNTTQTLGYALRLSGGSKLLKQGLYTFKIGSTGSMPIFIVPSGDGQMHYTAIFTSL